MVEASGVHEGWRRLLYFLFLFFFIYFAERVSLSGGERMCLENREGGRV